MAQYLVDPGKRFERPNGLFGTNWASPQARGLIGWWAPGLNNYRNLALPIAATPSPGVGLVGTGLGLAAEFIPANASYIDAGNVGDIGAVFSVVAWATSRLTGATGEILRYDVDEGSRDIVILRHESGQVRWYVNQNGNETSLYGPTGMADNLPHHYVGTHNMGAVSVYVDGASSWNTTGASGVLSTGTGLWTIGSFNGASAHWDGGIIDVRIYNRVLTPADVWELYDHHTRWDLYWQPGRRVFFDVGAAALRRFFLT